MERASKLAVGVSDQCCADGPVRLKSRVQLLRPLDQHPSSRERAADQRPVRLDEAEDAPDRNVRLEQVTDHLDLVECAVDELGAVPRSDPQALDPGPKDSTLDVQARTASVPLGIDDE